MRFHFGQTVMGCTKCNVIWMLLCSTPMLQCVIPEGMDIFSTYEQAINLIVSLCPQPDKFAHTYAGLAIWLTAGVVLRKPLYSIWPIVPVIALELANETMDRLSQGSWRWPDTLQDMAATWFWPVLLFGCMRFLPVLTGRPNDPPQTGSTPSAPPSEDNVERALPTVSPVGTPNGHNVGSMLAGRKPV